MSEVKNNVQFSCGFIALVGKPNVGKSTLLNRIVKEKISIISHRIHTTRNTIRAVVTKEHYQAILIDTPGIDEGRNRLQNKMFEAAQKAIQSNDITCYITVPVFANQQLPQADVAIFKHLSAQKETLLIFNKSDKFSIADIAHSIKIWNEGFPFKETFYVSALTGKKVEKVFDEIFSSLPKGEALFPPKTNLQTENFIFSEIIREQVFHQCRQEIPYEVFVEILAVKELVNSLKIFSTIHIQKYSLKKIIIGSKGQMLKNIGSIARRNIEYILKRKIFLDIHIKVSPGWQEKKHILATIK